MAIDWGGETLMSSCDRFEIKFAVGGTQVVRPPMTLLFSLLSTGRFRIASSEFVADCFLIGFSFTFELDCDDG